MHPTRFLSFDNEIGIPLLTTGLFKQGIISTYALFQLLLNKKDFPDMCLLACSRSAESTRCFEPMHLYSDLQNSSC